MNKKHFFFIFLLFGLISLGFADEFSEAANAIESASNAGKSGAKDFLQWTFALALPLGLMGFSAFLTYKFEKQKSEQDKETAKIYMKMAVAVLGGFFAYAGISMLVSRWWFGDFTTIFSKVIYAFFNSVFA